MKIYKLWIQVYIKIMKNLRNMMKIKSLQSKHIIEDIKYVNLWWLQYNHLKLLHLHKLKILNFVLNQYYNKILIKLLPLLWKMVQSILDYSKMDKLMGEENINIKIGSLFKYNSYIEGTVIYLLNLVDW